MKTLQDYIYFKNEFGTIYCGKNEKVMPLLKEKIDLLYMDPPYNFKTGSMLSGFYNRRSQLTIMQKLAVTFGHSFNPKLLLSNIEDLNHHLNMYVWTNKNLIPLYLNWALKHKYSFNLLHWLKMNRPPLIKNNYLPDTEYLLFFRKKRAYFNSNLHCIEKYRKYWITPVTTIKKYDHPTPKPLDITFAPIEISCPPGGVVCDPYCGTGTTLVAAVRKGRKFIGIDDTEKYCKISAGRVKKEVKELKLGMEDR